jgi:hypothetical protein
MMRFALMAAIVLGASAAQAQRVSKVDGSKLLTYCTSKNTAGCDAYLDGMGDGLAAAHHEKQLACIPKDVTTAQMRDVVIKYIHDNPQVREKSAARLTSDAFLAAFPCRS